MKNFQRELEKILSRLEKNAPLENRPSLLLHACCAPCSSHVIECLAEFFRTTILYYNPNIFPEEEYRRRFQELKNFIPRFSPAKDNAISIVEIPYNPQEFYDGIKISFETELAREKEKGERCRRCYELRLRKSFEYASQNEFDFFCTTLSISPFKDAEKINCEGEKISGETSGAPKWLYSDFKKKGGFLRSLELSKEFGLYRQQYCGCVYSKNSAEEKSSTSS